MSGGRYVAEDRGAFDAVEAEAVELATTRPATAPLYEIAAVHDRQPPAAWLLMFYRWYGDLS